MCVNVFFCGTVPSKYVRACVRMNKWLFIRIYLWISVEIETLPCQLSEGFFANMMPPTAATAPPYP